MQSVLLHSSRRPVVSKLLAEPEAVLAGYAAMLTQPKPIRDVLQVIFSLKDWEALSLVNIQKADEKNPFNFVALQGELDNKKTVTIFITGDRHDAEGAAKPSTDFGSLVVVGTMPWSLANLLDELLRGGWRLIRDRHHQPSEDAGLLKLVLGRSSEQSLSLQIVWGEKFDAKVVLPPGLPNVLDKTAQPKKAANLV